MDIVTMAKWITRGNAGLKYLTWPLKKVGGASVEAHVLGVRPTIHAVITRGSAQRECFIAKDFSDTPYSSENTPMGSQPFYRIDIKHAIGMLERDGDSRERNRRLHLNVHNRPGLVPRSLREQMNAMAKSANNTSPKGKLVGHGSRFVAQMTGDVTNHRAIVKSDII